ncbi:hypothetical protein HDU87_002318 [Geranomyces variabilis]|uniref:Uncharacterized protein n=1 Tax=Geranomyces variabilis TaxID=109894 RepID=A0AAD5TLI9_9FUNG|nr:hypothetical protein HDU87_002318 [Geranomyces variabilis]
MSDSFPAWGAAPRRPAVAAPTAVKRSVSGASPALAESDTYNSAETLNSSSSALPSYDELTLQPLADFWTAQPADPSQRLMSVYQDPVTRNTWVHAPAPDLRGYVETKVGKPVTFAVYEDPALVCREWTANTKLVCTAAVKPAIEARGFKVSATVEQLWGPEIQKSERDMIDCRMCHKTKPRSNFSAANQLPGVRKCFDCEREYDRVALGGWAVERNTMTKTTSTTPAAAKKASSPNKPTVAVQQTKTIIPVVAASAEVAAGSKKSHRVEPEDAFVQTRWGSSDTIEVEPRKQEDDGTVHVAASMDALLPANDGTVHVVASMDALLSSTDWNDGSDYDDDFPPMIGTSNSSTGASGTFPLKEKIKNSPGSTFDQQKMEANTPCHACKQLANQKDENEPQRRGDKKTIDDAIVEQFEKFVISTSPILQRKNQSSSTTAEQGPKLPTPTVPHTCKTHATSTTNKDSNGRVASSVNTPEPSSPVKTTPKSMSPVKRTPSPTKRTSSPIKNGSRLSSPKKDPMPQPHQFEYIECNECDRELPRENFSGRQRRMPDGRRRCLECTREYEIAGQVGHANPMVAKSVATTGKVVTSEGTVLPFRQPLFKTWKNPGEELESGTKVKAHKRAAEYVRTNVRAKVGTGGWDAVDEEVEEPLWLDDEPWLSSSEPRRQRSGASNMIVGEDEFTVARRGTGVAVVYRPESNDSAAYFILAVAEGAAIVTGALDVPQETIDNEKRAVRVLVSARGAFAVEAK